MPTHRRGKSLSEALTLERSDEGALVVSNDLPNQNLKEGDEILGATINFEQLSKEDVLRVLKVMEPFNDKVQVLTRNNRSKSLGNLDQCASPETMLNNAYNKLYNAKIKKFIKTTEDSSSNGESTSKPASAGSSKVRLKHATDLPRLGVDFGLLKSKPVSGDLRDPDSAGDAGEVTYSSNLNLPPFGAHVPQLKANAQTPQLNAPDLNVSGAAAEDLNVNSATGIHLPKPGNPSDGLTVPHLERTQVGLDSSGKLRAPKAKMDIKGSAPKAPDLHINFDEANSKGTNKELKMPNMDLSGPSTSGPEYELRTPSVPSGQLSLKRLKTPDLNVDDPSCFEGLPKIKLSGRSPDLDLDVSGEREFQSDLNGPNVDGPSGKLTLPKSGVSGKREAHVETPGMSIESPKVKGKIRAPTVNAPEADLQRSKLERDIPAAALKGPSTKYKAPKFTMPKFDLPEIDVNKKLDFKTPNVDVSAPKFKGDVNFPDVDTKLDLNKPSGKLDLDADVSSGKLRLPKFSPKLFGSLPNKEGVDVNTGIATPKLQMKSPKINTDVPDMKVRSPNLDLSGGIDAPNVNLPNMEVNTQTPEISVGSPKIKMPKFKTPSTPSLGKHEFDANFNGPDVSMNAPSVSLKAPDVNVAAPSGKFRKPDLGLSGPKLGGPEMNLSGDINAPEVKTPKADFKAPHLDMSNVIVYNRPKLDVDTPDVSIGSPKGKRKMPKIKMPRFSVPSMKGPEIDGNLNGPELNANAPSVNLNGSKPDLDVDVALPSGKFKSGNLKMPELHGPDWDFNAPSGKVKLPKSNLSLPKGPNLDVDADLKSPNLNLKAPKFQSEINTPDLNMDFKTPELDVNAPDVNIASPKAKFKLPKFDLPSLKGPEIDGPNMDLNAPSLDIRSPKAGLDVPDVDVGTSGKIKMPNFNLPNLGLSSPKLDGPNLKLKSPDLDFSGPSLGGGVNAPDLNIPKADMPSGKLRMPELQGPDWDINPPSNTLKLPKFNLSGSLPKGPNVDLKSPDLHLKSPEMKGGIDAPHWDPPKMDLKAPKLDVRGPDVNIGSPKTKLKMPKLKMPKINLPNVKGPEVDGNFDGPDVDINAPNVNLKGTRPSFEMPDVDFGADIGSGLKAPNFAVPDVNLKRPTLDFDTPKLDVNMPTGKVKMPTLTKPKAELHSPDLDVHGPKLDVNGPDVNIGSPKTKFKMPKLKFPKFSFPGLKGPEIDGPDADVNVPNMNIRGSKPDLDMPDVDISGQSAKFSKPNLNLPGFDLSAPKFEGPNLDMKSPEVDISGSPKGKLKMPKLKMPKFSLPNLKGPEIDGNLNGPDLNANVPSLNLKGPKSDFDINAAGPSGKFKKPNLNLPDLGFSSPVLDGPNLDLKSPDLDISGPNIGGELKAPNINMPDLDMKSPKFNFNTPKLDVDMPSGKVKMPTLEKPKAELHAPDLDVDAPSGKLKFPKFNLSGTLPKGPNLDLNADVNSPDLSMKSPKVKGAFNSPDMDLPDMRLKAPKIDVGTPDVNIGSPKTRLKMPKFKMPNTSLPNIKGPEIDGNIDGPDVDINAPNAKLKGSKPRFEIPEVGFGTSLGKLEKPHWSIPDVGFSGPDVDGPDFNFGSPALNAKLPKGPNVNVNSDLKTPDIHLRAPNSKIKGEFNSPKMDLPKIGSKAPRLDMNVPEENIGLPEANIKKPKIKMPKGPKIDLNGDLQGPDINVPNVDVDNVKGKLKMPSINVSGPQARTPGMELSGHKLKGPAVNMPDVKLPDSRVKGPRIDLNAKRPDLELNGNMGKPDYNFSIPQVKGDIRGPDFDINGPSGNIQGPQVDLNSADRKFRLPSFKLPQFGGPDLSRTGSDIDFGASRQPTNISPPNANLSTKPPQMKENMTGPGINTANMDLGTPKVTMRNPQLHQKTPDLDRPSVRNRRSDVTGVNMKVPALDVDGDIKLQHHKRSTKMDVRPSYPLSDARLGHHTGFNHPDLNIDDFTAKDYVLRARGSKNTHQVSHNHGPLISARVVNAGANSHSQTRGNPSGSDDLYAKVQKPTKPLSNAQVPHLSQDSGIRAPDSTDSFLVTVFPSKIQNPDPTTRKYKTLGGAEFYATNVDLEVPNENDLKGSTFFFSNLV